MYSMGEWQKPALHFNAHYLMRGTFLQAGVKYCSARRILTKVKAVDETSMCLLISHTLLSIPVGTDSFICYVLQMGVRTMGIV